MNTTVRTSEGRAKSVLPSGVRTTAKKALRAYGMMTGQWRSLPDFLIIGAKRGGTTSLYNYLLEHPWVTPLFPSVENIKGIHFFDRNFDRGVTWYRSHFPSVGYKASIERMKKRRAIAGEASPYYLFHPLVPARAHGVVPHAKLIVLLRNPVDRAYSHYLERTRNGTEPLSFEEALAREPERLKGELDRLLKEESYYSFAHEHYSYVSQGLYLDQLEQWWSVYPRDQVCLIRSEDFFDDPNEVYRRVLEFLELPPWELREYRRYNYHASRDMSPSARRDLTAFFAPHNERLARYANVDLGWDT
jgi:Sulfotransferase domain